MKTGILAWLFETWKVIEKCWFKLFMAAFLRNLVSALAGSLVLVLLNKIAFWNILVATFIHMLVWSALESGYIKMCLSAARKEPVTFSMLFSGLSLTPLIFAVFATYWLATALGIVALVIPGIFVWIRFSLAGLLAVDQKKSLFDSFKTSLKMTHGYSRTIAMMFPLILVIILCPVNFTAIAELFLSVALSLIYLKINMQEESKA